MFGFGAKSSMVAPDAALPGHASPIFDVGDKHAVLGSSLRGPWAADTQVLYLASGCFWGAEELLWRVPGVVSTSVGYMGGYSPHPTYEEVCTGLTGHTETAMVAYDSDAVGTYDLLKIFWENHDPTQGFRQGNDMGTQYRSAIFYTTDEQRDLAIATRDAYQDVIRARGYGDITTQIAPASDFTYYLAEDYHQQYLAKNPNGYCGLGGTGVSCPVGLSL